MKRNIVINSTRSALLISDSLADAVKQVATDCSIGEEIYAFDTYIHVCYACKAIEGGYEIIEDFIPLKNFRSFLKCNNDDYTKVYKALIKSIINE